MPCTRARTHGLDHGAELEVELLVVLGFELRHDFVGRAIHVHEFLQRDDLRDHDLGMHVDAVLGAVHGRFENRADLHLVDFRVGDPEANAAVAQHRVDLLKVPGLAQHTLLATQRLVDVLFTQLFEGLGEFDDVIQHGERGLPAFHDLPVGPEIPDLLEQVVLGGQEFVHRRVEQTNRHRIRRHHRKEIDEVLPLDWQ